MLSVTARAVYLTMASARTFPKGRDASKLLDKLVQKLRVDDKRKIARHIDQRVRVL
jgi:hypothetical protein